MVSRMLYVMLHNFYVHLQYVISDTVTFYLMIRTVRDPTDLAWVVSESHWFVGVKFFYNKDCVDIFWYLKLISYKVKRFFKKVVNWNSHAIKYKLSIKEKIRCTIAVKRKKDLNFLSKNTQL